jgi:hypothetical protein
MWQSSSILYSSGLWADPSPWVSGGDSGHRLLAGASWKWSHALLGSLKLRPPVSVWERETVLMSYWSSDIHHTASSSIDKACLSQPTLSVLPNGDFLFTSSPLHLSPSLLGDLLKGRTFPHPQLLQYWGLDSGPCSNTWANAPGPFAFRFFCLVGWLIFFFFPDKVSH